MTYCDTCSWNNVSCTLQKETAWQRESCVCSITPVQYKLCAFQGRRWLIYIHHNSWWRNNNIYHILYLSRKRTKWRKTCTNSDVYMKLTTATKKAPLVWTKIPASMGPVFCMTNNALVPITISALFNSAQSVWSGPVFSNLGMFTIRCVSELYLNYRVSPIIRPSVIFGDDFNISPTLKISPIWLMTTKLP